jgi:hypothetical protein
VIAHAEAAAQLANPQPGPRWIGRHRNILQLLDRLLTIVVCRRKVLVQD